VITENQVEVFRRLRAPPELTGDEREEFRRVVSATPAEMLPACSLAGLIQYCRHVCLAKRIAERLELAIAEGRGQDVEILSKAQARETKVIGYLMTMLRLTPQSLSPGTRAAAKRAHVIESPWHLKPSRKDNPSPP